jgi:hypothetical protein
VGSPHPALRRSLNGDRQKRTRLDSSLQSRRSGPVQTVAPQPDLKDVIADDFQGTYTNGQRYGKDKAIATDPALAMLSRDRQLGEVKVRFFGDSFAIAYGAESRLRKDKDGKEARRCQVWTDTWLKRKGQWQIVAAQDTVIPCPQ